MSKDDKVNLESWLRESELYENPFTEKQKHILDAAEELFGERGFAETSTAEIARKAGVTEKTLFKHFPKKTDLLRRIVFGIAVKTLFPIQVKIMQNITGREFDSFEIMFETIVANRLETIQQHGSKIKVLLDELLFNPKFCKEFVELFRSQVLKLGTQMIERMQEKGKIRKDIPARILIATMMSVIMGVVFSNSMFGVKWLDEKNEDIKQIANLLATGFRPG